MHRDSYCTRARKPVHGFTLVELLVVISIIALLMSVLMPALARVQKQARNSVCMSNLRQWSLMWSMYLDDNEGYFLKRIYTFLEPGEAPTWLNLLRPYYLEPKMRLCPSATKLFVEEGGRFPFAAYPHTDSEVGSGKTVGDHHSYGQNHWLNDWESSPAGSPYYWKTVNSITTPSQVPMFMDAKIYVVAPISKRREDPPEYEGSQSVRASDGQMKRVCMNRHGGAVNLLFIDNSVRHVGLKQLWNFKWNPVYDLSAGDPRWPDWMNSLPGN